MLISRSEYFKFLTLMSESFTLTETESLWHQRRGMGSGRSLLQRFAINIMLTVNIRKKTAGIRFVLHSLDSHMKLQYEC